MNYYLVDYENVKCDGIEKLKDIKEGDGLVIFYSEQCKNISLDALSEVFSKKVVCQSVKVTTGTKNALDFQLSSYLGYLIGKNMEADTNYYIISNDKGYDCLCDYWQSLMVNVSRVATRLDSSISIAPMPILPASIFSASVPVDVKEEGSSTKKKKIKDADLATIDELNELLSPDDNPNDVLEIFNQYKTKVAINNGLAKKFKDSKKSSSIYRKLKPLLKEKNKN